MKEEFYDNWYVRHVTKI